MARIRKRSVRLTKRPAVFTTASILLLFGGIVSLVGLVLLMFTGSTIISLLQNPSIAKNEIVIASSFLLFFLVISLILAILDIIAGVGVWKLKRYGVVIGLVSSIISVLLAIFLIQSDYGFSLLYNLIEISLLVRCWKYLS